MPNANKCRLIVLFSLIDQNIMTIIVDLAKACQLTGNRKQSTVNAIISSSIMLQMHWLAPPIQWFLSLPGFINMNRLYHIQLALSMRCPQRQTHGVMNNWHSDILGVFDWWISESNFWPRPLRIRACVISTSGFQLNENEWKRSVYKMADEI